MGIEVINLNTGLNPKLNRPEETQLYMTIRKAD
jgi:hypothetical protein